MNVPILFETKALFSRKMLIAIDKTAFAIVHVDVSQMNARAKYAILPDGAIA